MASRTLPIGLKNIFDITIKAINLIRGKATNHRLFKNLCSELGAEHEVLLFYSRVRFLSRGRVLDRVFELRKEVLQFLHSKNEDLAKHFSDPTFNIGLAYLSDIFGKLNDVNLAIQGAKVTIIDASESVSALKEKLLLWKNGIVG